MKIPRNPLKFPGCRQGGRDALVGAAAPEDAQGKWGPGTGRDIKSGGKLM